jgi:KaiC/GvpD/RAD55 family RecA-like ATPase
MTQCCELPSLLKTKAEVGMNTGLKWHEIKTTVIHAILKKKRSNATLSLSSRDAMVQW